ncbi:hypothetical protein BS78_02G104400 [Paspalum vaginatum]|nr:hypothetical protein BS78_02G104400 [Paspalum vaginatum]
MAHQTWCMSLSSRVSIGSSRRLMQLRYSDKVIKTPTRTLEDLVVSRLPKHQLPLSCVSWNRCVCMI